MEVDAATVDDFDMVAFPGGQDRTGPSGMCPEAKGRSMAF